ncbi:UNVERIFIED_CONTAM: hypothetical protein Sangu_2605200 [Sesamum angustifolium]|uniref:Uncharacterized protein n=1 Tax=Sesamum angustifolium TaxID=2727405 RepID=A0AAW2J5F3_9LAMI
MNWRKRTTVAAAISSSPLKVSLGKGSQAQLGNGRSKCRTRQQLSEHICKLHLARNVSRQNKTSFELISHQITVYF